MRKATFLLPLTWFSLTVNLTAQSAVRLEEVAMGLEFPVSIKHAGDGSGRLFAVGLKGIIQIVKDGQVLPRPFLDIRDRVSQILEGGLSGLAFHPDFRNNRRFFVLYTTGPEDDFRSVLSEFRAAPGNPDETLIPERILLVVKRPTAIHIAGDLAFGPDGMLYVSSGDGGPTGDPFKTAQDLSLLLGKILRLDVDGPAPLTIPSDNPFVGQVGRRPEIWAYGFRNPFRMSFDRTSGRLFLGDVGEVTWEEINLIEKGGNYGWSRLEGPDCFPSEIPCDPAGTQPPIHFYGRDIGRAVIGGGVYRGNQTSSLRGAYIFADFITRRIFALKERGDGTWKRHDVGLIDTFMPTAFGEDEDGEMYVCGILDPGLFRLRFVERRFFPQVVSTTTPLGHFRTSVLLVNPSQEVVSGQLHFFTRDPNSEGRPSASLDIAVPSGSSARFEIPFEFENSFIGWAVFESDRPVRGQAVYTLLSPQEDSLTVEASLPAAVTAPHFTAFVARNATLGVGTALAVLNPSREPVDVELEIVAAGGGESQRETLAFQPLQRQAFVIGDLFDLPEGFEGTLRLSSPRDVALVVLATSQGRPSAALPID